MRVSHCTRASVTAHARQSLHTRISHCTRASVTAHTRVSHCTRTSITAHARQSLHTHVSHCARASVTAHARQSLKVMLVVDAGRADDGQQQQPVRLVELPVGDLHERTLPSHGVAHPAHGQAGRPRGEERLKWEGPGDWDIFAFMRCTCSTAIMHVGINGLNCAPVPVA